MEQYQLDGDEGAKATMKIYLILEDAYGDGYFYRGVEKTREEAEVSMAQSIKEEHFPSSHNYEIHEVEL